MRQVLTTRVRGLFTSNNQISEAPPGSLSVASNVNIDKDGLVETRRGFAKYGNVLAGMSNIYSYNNNILQFDGSLLSYDSDAAGTWVNYSGTYTKPTYNKVHSYEANSSFFFNTVSGVYKISSLTGTPALSGVPRGLEGNASTTGSGWLANNKVVAYRVVFGITDANNFLVMGSPSSRWTLSNTSGGAVNASVTFTLPSDITTSHTYYVYRSNQFTTTADDELYLCYQGQPTSGEVTAGLVTFTDTISDALRQEIIYTAPSQEGVVNENEYPPICNDMLYFQNVAVYANTVWKHNKTFRLIVTGGTGLVNADTITVDGVAYTAAGTETISTGTFKVYTGGTAVDDINNTMDSLCRVINRYTSNTTIYAYNLSSSLTPGLVYIEKRTFAGAQFTIISSRGSAFAPVLPSAGSTFASSNDTALNRLYVSKPNQVEAVPFQNYLEIGSASNPIQRIIANVDSIFVFKGYEGVFRVVGTDISNMYFSSLDPTCELLGLETPALVNGYVFAWTNKGIVRISDSYVESVSDNDLQSTISNISYLTGASTCFGVGYNAERKYIFFAVQSNLDTVPTIAYVYNFFTNAWTTWSLTRNCGIVINKFLYLGRNDAATYYIYKERKSNTLSDYSDDSFTATIVSATDLTITFSSTANMAAGMIVSQSGKNVVIDSVDSATVVTVETNYTWSAGSATIYVPFISMVEFTQQNSGNPGMLKQYREATFLFTRSDFNEIELGFSSAYNANIDYTTISIPSLSSWGNFAWGTQPWGNSFFNPSPIRVYIPTEHQRTMWVNPSVKLSRPNMKFVFAGISMVLNDMSEKMR